MAQLRGRVELYPGHPPANSATDPNPTAWWFRPVIRAARVGEQRAQTWNALYRRRCSAKRWSVGVWHGPPNADGLPNPASSISTSSTLGAPGGAFTGSG